MTMPHLMNCQHSEDGWCLDCVKAEHEDSERVVAELMSQLEAMRSDHANEIHKWTKWNGDGRRESLPRGVIDGSSWGERVFWFGADSFPVHGHIVLLYLEGACEVAIADFRGFQPDEVRNRMDIVGARWWAHVPHGPPLNVKPLGFTSDNPPNDPPPAEWISTHNIPAVILDDESEAGE